MQPDITAKSWIMVATLGLVWGASFLFIELALTGVGPFWLTASRILFAGLLTTAIWKMRGGPLYETDERAGWVPLLAVGVLSSALPFVAISWGQQFVTSGFAGVSMAAVALVVLPLAHFFVPGERLTLRKSLGFLIGFIGVAVLIGPEAFRSTEVDGELFGRFACVLGAACYAVSSVVMRRLPPVDPVGLSAVTLLIGAVPVTVLAAIVEGVPPMPSAEVAMVILTLGLVQTAAANLLRVMVIRSAGPVFMSLTNYQVPLWSVLLGVLLLGESVEASLFMAMVLILTGVFLSQRGALRRLFSH
ncbi:DMT family transporter [uncultured Boseongicola sp.]|jgi:drug/metabolite transporter (DMT)-like permease|uniref:DMT family transporter n=1 Tax=uncultured Boseongicola sp. TaxID=1648499 RepID=UPI002611584A|nr:DMT family transporter [uncultured Boseongicola sp.]